MTLELLSASDSASSSAVDSHMSSILVGVAIVLSSTVAIPLAKNFARKTLLLVSASGVSACLFVLGTSFYLESLGAAADVVGWLPLVTFMLYIVCFMVSFSKISFISGEFVMSSFIMLGLQS